MVDIDPEPAGDDSDLDVVDPRTLPVRFSRLSKLVLSPAHYFEACQERAASTPSMTLGKLAHRIVLGGEVIVYDGARRGKPWQAFKAEHAGKFIVTATEHARAMGMANAIARHADAMALLAGDHEVELDFEMLGRKCQAHVDVLGGNAVTELKTARLSSPGWFMRDALWRNYHSQLGWYQDAANCCGHVARDAYIVAVESTAPYVVTCFEVQKRALEQGRKVTRIWLERLLDCERTNEWPGYVQRVIELDVPDVEANEDPPLIFEEDVA